MKKIYETILGLLSSLVIFSSPAETKKASCLFDEYHIPDTPNISSLDDIRLIPEPPPLILKQSDCDAGNLFARHGSHSSHASHASHQSHVSHYSGSTSPSKTEESEPTKTEKPSAAPSSTKPLDVGPKEWNTSAEWLRDPCKLQQREVIIYLKDDSRHQGSITECKKDSIQIKKEIQGSSDEAKQWLEIKDVKAILWR